MSFSDQVDPADSASSAALPSIKTDKVEHNAIDPVGYRTEHSVSENTSCLDLRRQTTSLHLAKSVSTTTTTTAYADPELQKAAPSHPPPPPLHIKLFERFGSRWGATNASGLLGLRRREQQRQKSSSTRSSSSPFNINSLSTINPLLDGLSFIQYAGQSLVQDEFTKCFVQKPRSSLLSALLRGPIYLGGWFIRYCILFPCRLSILLTATAFFFTALPVVLRFQSERCKRWLMTFYCKAFLLSWGARIRRHGTKPKLNVPHLFVANHTSFIDFVLLSAHDSPHAAVAQHQGGLFGYFQRRVLNLIGSVSFDRSDRDQKALIRAQMKKHTSDPNNSPLLVFPEGTCVNNEYTVLFQKGAFELGATICPVAIKYDKSWADAYWHSRAQSFTTHLLYLMTRWRVVADIWYLEPQTIPPGMSAADFANLIKGQISEVARLKNLSWDGYLKNYAPAKEKQEQWISQSQNRYVDVLMNRSLKRPRRASDSSLRPHQPQEQSLGPELESCEETDEDDSGLDTNLKNYIMISLQDHQSRTGMIDAIADKKSDVVETWKKYTKIRQASGIDNIQQKRIENMSWRMWNRQRLEAQQQQLPHMAETFLNDLLILLPSPFTFSDTVPTSPSLGSGDSMYFSTASSSSSSPYPEVTTPSSV